MAMHADVVPMPGREEEALRAAGKHPKKKHFLLPPLDASRSLNAQGNLNKRYVVK
jgi:hypothetical protein